MSQKSRGRENRTVSDPTLLTLLNTSVMLLCTSGAVSLILITLFSFMAYPFIVKKVNKPTRLERLLEAKLSVRKPSAVATPISCSLLRYIYALFVLISSCANTIHYPEVIFTPHDVYYFKIFSDSYCTSQSLFHQARKIFLIVLLTNTLIFL